MAQDGTLANGVRLLWLETVDSTNEEARRRHLAGEPGPLWIAARTQSAGRGRLGRQWISQPGNLYATLLVTCPVPLAVAAQVSLVAALGMADTLARLAPEAPVRLKWPNDVFIGAEKVSGILVETLSPPSSLGVALAVGCGLNLAHAPEHQRRPATALARHGVTVTPRAALEALAQALAFRFSQWDEGRGFALIRDCWMVAAGGVGSPVEVDVAGTRTAGIFVGLDAEGALRLRLPDGFERIIRAGEVSTGASA